MTIYELAETVKNLFGYSDDEISVCSGVMGVPITFLDKFNPEQFEILGITNHGDMAGIPYYNGNCFAEVNGKRMYVRIFIRRRKHA